MRCAEEDPSGSPTLRYLRIVGHLWRDNRLELMPAYATGDPRHARDDERSRLQALLLDGDGRLLLRHGLALEDFCSQGREVPALAVRGTVPLPHGTRTLRLELDGLPIRELAIGDQPIRLTLLWQPKEVQDGVQVLRWRSAHERGAALEYLVRFSHDGGATWRRIGARTRKEEQPIDFARLPGGARCRVEVVASDGVSSALARSRAFRVAVKPFVARITTPAGAGKAPAGRPVMLRGQGYCLEEARCLTAEQLRWSSSLDGELGRGAALLVPRLSPGRHTIRLRAGSGKRAGEASVEIEVEGGA